MDNGQARCFCEEGWTGAACDVEDADHAASEFDVSGNGSPIGIALAALVGALFVLMIGGYVYNYAKGKRGMAAIPGYSLVKGKTVEDQSHYSRVE
jgi:hypothetical protein